MDGELDQCVICHLWRGQTGAEQTCIYRIVLDLFLHFQNLALHFSIEVHFLILVALISCTFYFMYFLPVKPHYYALVLN